MTAPASTIDRYAVALVAACRAALPTVSVVDGPPLSWVPVQLAGGPSGEEVTDRLFLFVGASPSEDSVAAARLDYRGAGNVSRDEVAGLRCTILTWTGDNDVPGMRAAAFGLLDQVDQVVLRPDRSLGGVVLFSRVASVDAVVPDLDEHGAAVLVEFTVEFRAYLT